MKYFLIFLMALIMSSCVSAPVRNLNEHHGTHLEDVSKVINKVYPSIVRIEAYKDKEYEILRNYGTGFFFEDEDSGNIYIATAGHIVEEEYENEDEEIVTKKSDFYYMAIQRDIVVLERESSNERKFPIELVFYIPFDEGDLAVFKFKKSHLNFKPTPLGWGDSTKLRPGEWLIAIGAPNRIHFNYTLGMVSQFNAAFESAELYLYMVHSASISFGNSGGPAVDLSGKVMGMNLRGTEGNPITFARTSAEIQKQMVQFLGPNNPNK